MRESFQKILLVAGWAVLISSITLQVLYARQFMVATDLVLLLVVSIFAGFVLVDIQAIVLGYLAALALSFFIMFFFLSLPATLGVVAHTLLKDLVYSGAISMIVKFMFPIPMIVCLMGGLLGGYFGERFLS